MIRKEGKEQPMTYKIKIVSHNETITAQENDLLADKIQDAGIDLSVYCNKKGLCGKCFVEILEGKLPALDEKEEFLLKHKRLNKNFRLSCLYTIKSDLSIKIPDESIIHETYILTSGIKSVVSVNPAVKKYNLQIKKPEISSPDSLQDLFLLHFKDKNHL